MADLDGPKPVLIRRVVEGLGRLAFAARVFYWIRLFLAPIYAWTNAVTSRTVLKPSLMVRLVAHFIHDCLRGTKKRIPCDRPERVLGEWFRTDAKGAKDFAVLGGWTLGDSGNTKDARWFSIKITPRELP